MLTVGDLLAGSLLEETASLVGDLLVGGAHGGGVLAVLLLGLLEADLT